MSLYERLMADYPHLEYVEDKRMPRGLSGLYYDGSIRINAMLSLYEKTSVLGEELGHHETTYGNIIKLNSIRNRKIETVARRWGHERIIPLDKLIECYSLGYTTVGEVCVHLEITDIYLKNVLEFYKEKYGIYRIHNGYQIHFDPLNIKAIK